MSWVWAATAGIAVYLLATATRTVRLADLVAPYLRVQPDRVPEPGRDDDPTLLQAGLSWSRAELAARRMVALAIGAALGALAAQGDLFVAGTGRSVLPLTILGGAGGLLAFSMWLTTRRERRARALRFELPVVADAVALLILAGEPVMAAIEGYVGRSSGVAAEELARVLEAHDAGTGAPEALARAGRTTADPEAARLYGLLGHAHVTGGRLVEALADLAIDYRASLAREMSAESGSRAVASYGPVLALMVPIAMVFLLYPTLLGLRSLAGGP